MLAGAAAARGRADEAALHTAWTTAALCRTAWHTPKKFPPWRKIAPKRPGAVRRVMDGRAVQAMARLWTAALGGEIRDRDE